MKQLGYFQCDNCGITFSEVAEDDCADHEANCLSIVSGNKVVFQVEGRQITGIACAVKKAHIDGYDVDIPPEIYVRSDEAFLGAALRSGGFEKWIPYEQVIKILS